MSDLKTRLIPRNFRKKRKRSSKDDENDDGIFCLRKSLKNSDWGNILSKIEVDEVRLADISKHCTMMPPKYYQSILDRMIRPKSGHGDFESEDFTIEFNFDFFGQSRNTEIIEYSAPGKVLEINGWGIFWHHWREPIKRMFPTLASFPIKSSRRSNKPSCYRSLPPNQMEPHPLLLLYRHFVPAHSRHLVALLH